MRILLLTPFLPSVRAPHGGGAYLGALARGLAAHVELGLVHLAHANEPAPEPDLWRFTASAPYVGGGGGPGHRLRMLWRWRRKPLLVAKYWQPSLRTALRRAREQFAPCAALVEMAQMAQYLELPELADLPTILTDHEAGRPANADTGLGPAADARDERLWRTYVPRSYGRATALQAVTDEDAAALRERLGRDVATRPPTLGMPARTVDPAAAPARALFVGDYRHAPNREAAQRLCDEVWPRVLAGRPDAELWLVGPNEAPIAPLAERPGVRVTGMLPDLAAAFAAARLMLAPLWSGGGFRVKNATALAHGLPIVTNALGARGCRAPEPACTVAETAEELAAAAVRLLDAPALAADAGASARSWALARYAVDPVAQDQLRRIEALL